MLAISTPNATATRPNSRPCSIQSSNNSVFNTHLKLNFEENLTLDLSSLSLNLNLNTAWSALHVSQQGQLSSVPEMQVGGQGGHDGDEECHNDGTGDCPSDKTSFFDYDTSQDGAYDPLDYTRPIVLCIGHDEAVSVGMYTEDIPSADTDAELLRGLSSGMVAVALMGDSGNSDLVSRLSPPITEFPLSEFTNSSHLSPATLGYQLLSPLSKRAFARRKVIEEIIHTEETFISSLKMLSGIYLATLIEKGNNGIPLRLIHDYVDIMIASHEEFLDKLQNLYSISFRQWIDPFPDSPDFDDKVKQLISCSSPLMGALVAELISKKLISVYVYQEYNTVQELVFKLMNAKENDPDIGRTLTKSFQRFLEASQTTGVRMDLSFMSLISQPVSRLGKYKLFLDALLKLTPLEEDVSCYKKIEDCIVQTDYCIKEVNRYGLQEKNKANILFSSLCFPPGLLKFPVEYLGLPLVNGAIYTCWVINREQQVQGQLFATFLFKTHVIFAQLIKPNRYEVKFLVPLAVSKIVDVNDSKGGIYTNFEQSFKLLFEHDYKVYELLLLFNDLTETGIWREKFDILTNVINGPYQFDYSSSRANEEKGTYSSTMIPMLILAYDAKVDIVGEPHSIRGKFHGIYQSLDIMDISYFREVISIKVEFCDESRSSSRPSSMRFRNRFETKTQLVHLKQSERGKIEAQMENLWSDELVSKGVLDRRSKSTRRRRLAHSDSYRKGIESTQSSKRKGLDHPTREQHRVGTINKPTSRFSLMRKTSIVFGDAFKSFLGSGKL